MLDMIYSGCFFGQRSESDVFSHTVADNVTHLDYCGHNLLKDTIQDFEAINVSKLRYLCLRLYHFGPETDQAVCALLERCENLEYLKIDQDTPVKLGWLNNCRKLKTLNVSTDEPFKNLKWKNQIMCLDGCINVNAVLQHFPSLCHAHDETIRCIAVQELFKAGKTVNFEEHELEPMHPSTVSWAAKVFPQTKTLSVDMGCADFPLEGLKNFYNVEVLTLQNLKLTFDFKQLNALKKLKHLVLRCCKTEIGSLSLNCPNLKLLEIDNCRQEVTGDFAQFPNASFIRVRGQNISNETMSSLLSSSIGKDVRMIISFNRKEFEYGKKCSSGSIW